MANKNIVNKIIELKGVKHTSDVDFDHHKLLNADLDYDSCQDLINKIVRTSDKVNKVSIDESKNSPTFRMLTVNDIDQHKIIQLNGDNLILDCGSSQV